VTQHERRRHPRYLLRLPIQLQRGEELLSAYVVNASAGGCLMQLQEPLTPGEVVTVTIPELRVPEARLVVLRCDITRLGYMVATYFEVVLIDERFLREASEAASGGQPPLLH
jgi:PilZ domain